MARSETDQIRERINIIDFINEHVALKKTGRNFKALCPFHNEKTPSFIVSPERQIWHCFGCGKGGDLFTFLMELEHLEFPEALRILADRAGVKLPTRGVSSFAARQRERLLTMHQFAADFYHFLLTQHRSGDQARSYLKQRGVSDKTIKTFMLGYAPSGWRNLTRFFRKKNYTDKDLVDSGLAIRHARVYDRFRGRIVFPIKNHRGQVIAFSGRVLKKSESAAKYINSPETPIYTKGDTLYGLDITKEAIKKEKQAIIVEGEFDVISSFQAGVSNIVAIKGSALTEAQVRLLKRFTEMIILALDSDQAGDAAARRGIEIADHQGLDTRVVALPTNKDPDETIRENAASWKQMIKKAVPFYDFLITSALSRFNLEEAYGKKKITDELLPVFARIENPIVQAHYVKHLSSKIDISEERIAEALKKASLVVKKSQDQTKTKSLPTSKKSHEELLEEHLLSLVLQADNIRAALQQVTEQLDPSGFRNLMVKKIFIALIDFVSQNQEIKVNQFIKSLPDELVSLCDRLYLVDLSSLEGEKYWRELTASVNTIKRTILRNKIKQITTHISKLEKEGKEEKLNKLSTELQVATDSLKELQKKA